MARNFILPPPVVGAGDIFALLDLIRNEEKYTQRVNELLALQQQVHNEITLLAKLEEAPGIVKLAEARSQDAENIVKQSQEQAAATIAEAEQRANKIVADAQAVSEETQDFVSRALANLERESQELSDRKKLLDLAAETVKHDREKIDLAAVELGKKEAELLKREEEINKKAETISKLTAMLGPKDVA